MVAVVLLHTSVVCCSLFNPEKLCEGLGQSDSVLLNNQVNQLTIERD